MNRRTFITAVGAGLAGPPVVPRPWPPASVAAAQATRPWHTPRKAYPCLYNVESLMHCNEDISSAKIKWVIEKLRGTDVDAIMCCPTAWRTNMFPSEVDPEWKEFTHIRDVPAFQPFDHVMKYVHDGGDPVRDQLEATRGIGADFFISYRMNDWHEINNKSFPTHNAFWREHPECCLGDRDRMGLSDNLRLFNYLMPAVRDHYFAIIEELCTRYDVDGVELDFQRAPRFFHDGEIQQGTAVMTGFVERIRGMMNRIGRERGKPLKLCVRIPDCIAACTKAGLDVVAWDAAGLIDMINLSSFFYHSMEIDIEGVKATTIEMYRATAMNFLRRGADGLSVFNLDYVDGDCYNLRVSRLERPLKRLAMVEMLRGITDLNFLAGKSKNYIVYPNPQITRPAFPAADEQSLRLFVADDTSKARFAKGILRVETKEDSTALRIGAMLNGHSLERCETKDTELFEPVHRNQGFPGREVLKFFTVPLDRLVVGNNQIEITNLDKMKTKCTLFSMELALYK
ncbi:MAG TPA: hypothetical protein VMY37_17140 [Thermoguttaceae bacterium]|nr:hypothetical protein [Thermoguttaceae bacterium]